MRKRKNLTLSPVMLERAAEVMKARGFDELSDFVAALIREEYERRHAPVLYDKPASAPPTESAHYNKPAPSLPPVQHQAELEARKAFELAELAAGAPGPTQSASGPQPPASPVAKPPRAKRNPQVKKVKP